MLQTLDKRTKSNNGGGAGGGGGGGGSDSLWLDESCSRDSNRSWSNDSSRLTASLAPGGGGQGAAASTGSQESLSAKLGGVGGGRVRGSRKTDSSGANIKAELTSPSDVLKEKFASIARVSKVIDFIRLT